MLAESSSDHRRALTMLAESPDGCTEALLMAHGFRLKTLAELIVAGLATMKSESTQAGGRRLR